MTDTSCRILLIGMPGTGKTTFLAALWHVVESGEVAGSLNVQSLTGNREYLSRIRDDWQGCRALQRTLLSEEQDVRMLLKDDAKKRDVEVVLPDLSGETFQQQLETRQWPSAYQRQLEESAGAMVFVHPSKVAEPVRIEVAERLMMALPPDVGGAAVGTPEAAIEWSMGRSPTQVQLVELLQFTESVPRRPNPFPVAVVISAWDLLENHGKTPESWLENRLPLFWQFLRANADQYPTRVFGVSAQGGDLSKDSDRLLRHHPASTRIVVVESGSTTNDISSPIRWLMG